MTVNVKTKTCTPFGIQYMKAQILKDNVLLNIQLVIKNSILKNTQLPSELKEKQI